MENFKKIEKNKKSNIGGGEWGQLGEDKVIIFKLKKKDWKKKIKFDDWKIKKK
jgi:hypothetical protein